MERRGNSSPAIKARSIRSVFLPLLALFRILMSKQYPARIMFLLYAVLLLFPLLRTGRCDECQPGFADSCFSSVADDLKYMLNLKKMLAVNITWAAVHDLCLSLDDSLNCTVDIIDTDCTEDDGKGKFDAWIRALRGAYNYICGGEDHRALTNLLRGIQCWSIDDFMLCSEEHLGTNHIRDLLHTAIDDVECMNLHSVTNHCTRDASVGSCREQDDVSAEVGNMIHAFFLASDCENEKGLPVKGHAPSFDVGGVTLLSLLSSLLLTVL